MFLQPDEGVVEVGVGAGDEVENVDDGGEVAGEGECNDELGGDVRVLVEVVLEDLGMDLLHGVEVGATVEDSNGALRPRRCSATVTVICDCDGGATKQGRRWAGTWEVEYELEL